jgi:peptidoglycan DL-endopeptidase CwlO
VPHGESNLRFPRRRAVVAIAVGLVASLGLPATSGAAGPAAPDGSGHKPTIGQVRASLDTLNRQAEIASEDLNAMRVRTADARQRLSAVRADVRRQRASVAGLRSQVVGATLSSYQSAGGLSATTSFLVADDPKTFLTNLADDAVDEHQQAAVLTRLMQEQDLLTARRTQARIQLDAVRADKAQLSRQKALLATRIDKAKSLLAHLQAKQRARLLALQRASESASPAEQASRDATRPAIPDVATSGRAQIAVNTALAQIGDPYVYGAAGPDAFDCSGLTMYAWAAAGVSIPHASSMQPSAGTPVSISALRPGDLVFYYSPISHVAMYIGNGQVVHAPHTGSYVQIVPLDSMPIAMAVRIG